MLHDCLSSWKLVLINDEQFDFHSTSCFPYTVDLQWLEHRWLVYHGYFELVLESIGKNPIAADIIIFGITQCDFLFHIDNVMLCVLIRIASMLRF